MYVPDFWKNFFTTKTRVFMGYGLLVVLLILNIWLLMKYMSGEGFADMKLPFRTMAGYYP